MAAVSCMLLFHCCLFVILVSYASAQLPILFCDNNKGNYTTNSTYHSNLNTLLSTLSSNTEINYGFYNFSYGQNADKVNAIGLCRGDVNPDECRSCLNVSRVNLTQFCPNQKEAIGWYDKCMLRYSNRTIFDIVETSPTYYMWNPNNATNVDQFRQELNTLMNKLTVAAASGDSRRKYAANDTTAVSFQTIYGLAQCTPDLSELDCNNCLLGAIGEIPDCCNGKRGGRVIKPSCNIRFENFRFYGEPTATADAPAPAPAPALF